MNTNLHTWSVLSFSSSSWRKSVGKSSFRTVSWCVLLTEFTFAVCHNEVCIRLTKTKEYTVSERQNLCQDASNAFTWKILPGYPEVAQTRADRDPHVSPLHPEGCKAASLFAFGQVWAEVGPGNVEWWFWRKKFQQYLRQAFHSPLCISYIMHNMLKRFSCWLISCVTKNLVIRSFLSVFMGPVYPQNSRSWARLHSSSSVAALTWNILKDPHILLT